MCRLHSIVQLILYYDSPLGFEVDLVFRTQITPIGFCS